jgi:preprotein translocase SecE subunit
MGLVNYIKETRGEMKHVNWPTNSQAINYTVLVVGVTVVTAVILSVADYVFGLGLEKFIINQ